MLAAANLSIALDLADQKTFGAVVNKATINDDGRKQWVAARAGIEIGPVQKDRIPTLKAWTATVSSDHNTSESPTLLAVNMTALSLSNAEIWSGKQMTGKSNSPTIHNNQYYEQSQKFHPKPPNSTTKLAD